METKQVPSGNRGEFSGNPILKEMDGETRILEERDFDNENTRKLWLEEIPSDPDFIEDMKDELEGLKSKLGTFPTTENGTIHIITQSHIDMAWKWRYRQTRRKGIKTYQKAVFHAEKFPGFRFAASEPCLLQWIKEDDPELFQKIQYYVEKGNLEIVGGAWVEPDCMMPSGEAFIRQRLYGMRFYRDEFGKLPEVEWFLDSFGYNIGLPQILAKSGAKFFWTNKMTWNLQTTFPFVNFWWQSPDGTKLFTSNFGQNQDSFAKWKQFEPGRYLLKPDGKKIWNYYDDYADLINHVDTNQMNPALGYFIGKGDGGHGPTHQEVMELDAKVEAGKTIGLNFQWSTAQAYFEQASQLPEQIPTWADELYLENHRGTFSVHSETKRHNRRLERYCQAAEEFATLVSLSDPNFKYPQETLEKAWKMVLLNHFHDVLPGSSVPEVYDDIYSTWVELDNLLGDVMKECAKRIQIDNAANVYFFNPLAQKRKERVFIPISVLDAPPDLVDDLPPYMKLIISDELAESRELICQPVAAEQQDRMFNRPAGWWTIIEIDSMGYIEGKLIPAEKQGNDLFIEVKPQPRLNNGISAITLDPITGALVEFKSIDLNQGKNLVYGKESLIIKGYEDRSKAYPAWNLTPEYWKYPKNFAQDKEVEISISAQGPIFSTLKIEKTLGISKSCLEISLFRDDPQLYCNWYGDWQEKDVMLKLIMDTDTNAEYVTTDEMYCALKQSTLPTTPNDKARYEKVMHTYADLSTPTNAWGIAMINEGKYAFDASAGRMRLTLHRSPEYPAPAAEAWVNLERSYRKETEGTEPPTHSGLGKASARIAFLPHKGGALHNELMKANAEVKVAAEQFNTPIYSGKMEMNHGDKTPMIGLGIYTPQNISISSIKKKEWTMENALIMRMVEFCGIDETHANILFPEDFAKQIEKIEPVDLIERPMSEEFSWNDQDGQLDVKFGKFEIKTFQIFLKKQ